jgi:hypothetical protein
MLARVGMSSIKFNLVFPCWMMHIWVTPWAKRKRTLTLLLYQSWVQKKGEKLEPKYFPLRNDARSLKGRHGQDGRKARKRPIRRRDLGTQGGIVSTRKKGGFARADAYKKQGAKVM